MTDSTQATAPSTIADEDRGRAEFYAVLARLLTAPPDAPFLATLGAAAQDIGEEAPPLIAAWKALAAASRDADAEEVAAEYTDLFVGVAKAEFNLHASYWVRDAAPRPLVAVRAALTELGLVRTAHWTIYEDHLGALCETMRILVAGMPGRHPAPLAVQRDFFQRQIAPWALGCCAALAECAVANYYTRVGQFALELLAVERDSLAIE